MNEATAVLVGALVGAAAGLAGGGFAALASLRASQLAARAPLGPILHGLSQALVRVRTTQPDRSDYWEAQREFELRWNEFSIQQRILCPSNRIAELMSLIQAIGRNESDPPKQLLNLAGQTMEKITQMVAAHGNSLFRLRAWGQERRIIRYWMKSKQAEELSEPIRKRLSQLAQSTLTRLFVRGLSLFTGE